MEKKVNQAGSNNASKQFILWARKKRHAWFSFVLFRCLLASVNECLSVSASVRMHVSFSEKTAEHRRKELKNIGVVN